MPSKVLNKEALIKELFAHKEEIRALGVKKLGLFGSFARNTKIHFESDVDFFVEFYPGQKNFDNFMDLSFFLEEILGRKIDIVTPQSLSKYIGPHILKQVEHVLI